MTNIVLLLLAFASMANTALYFIIKLNFDFMKNRLAILERQAEIVKLERWMDL